MEEQVKEIWINSWGQLEKKCPGFELSWELNIRLVSHFALGTLLFEKKIKQIILALI